MENQDYAEKKESENEYHTYIAWNSLFNISWLLREDLKTSKINGIVYNGRHNGCCPCTCTLCCSRIKVHKKQYSQMLQLHSSLKDCYKYTGCKQQQFFKCFGGKKLRVDDYRTKQITKSIARNIDMLTTF